MADAGLGRDPRKERKKNKGGKRVEWWVFRTWTDYGEYILQGSTRYFDHPSHLILLVASAESPPPPFFPDRVGIFGIFGYRQYGGTQDDLLIPVGTCRIFSQRQIGGNLPTVDSSDFKLDSAHSIDILHAKHVLASECPSFGMLYQIILLLFVLTTFVLGHDQFIHDFPRPSKILPRPPRWALPHTGQSVQPPRSGAHLKLTWRSRHCPSV